MKTTQLFRLISIINSLFIIPACSAQNPSQSLIEDIFEDLSVNNSVDNADVYKRQDYRLDMG